MNYSNLLLVGNLIIIDMLCIYHLPAIPPEYINFYIDPEYLSFHSNSHHVYSMLACCSLLLPLTHIFDWLWQFQSHLIDPGFEWKDVSVYQHPPPPPPPRLSQFFSNKVIQWGGGQGGCSISTGYMRFEICILLCHFCLFWRFSNKTAQMSPFIGTPPDLQSLLPSHIPGVTFMSLFVHLLLKVYHIYISSGSLPPNNRCLCYFVFRSSENIFICFIFSKY